MAPERLLLDRKEIQGWAPAHKELLEHGHKIPLGRTPHAANAGRTLLLREGCAKRPV